MFSFPDCSSTITLVPETRLVVAASRLAIDLFREEK